MKKKLIYVFVLLLLFGAGCSNLDSQETKQDKVVIKDQNEQKNDEVKDDKKKEEKAEEKENADSKEITNSNSSNNKQSSTKEKDSINQSNVVKEEHCKQEQSSETVTPPSKPITPPKQETVQPPKEEVKEAPVKQSSMAASVMNQINNYRIQKGLQPLESTQYYQDKADAHALDMANKRALWHSDNGECITNHPDPFNAWINSPEHREIILRENNTKGVVSVYYVDGYYYSVFQTSW